MKKSKNEIENEKFWRDIIKQARKNALKEQKQAELEQKKEERKQQISKKSFFSGFQGSQRSEKIPFESTYEFQTENFQENKPIKAVFKLISMANTAAGGGRTGNYIGRIDKEEEQALFYRGYCGNFNEDNEEELEEIETKDQNSKEFLNFCFEEEIRKISPTRGAGSEVESYHCIFSLPSYTRTLENRILPKEELNKIIKTATINTIRNNKILSNRAVEMAIHQENHSHLNICATNFYGEKDLKFMKRNQQMDILRDFARECRKQGLNVEIPFEKKAVLNLKELNKITNIEYKQNDQIKAITLENEQGGKKRLMAVSINDFMSQNKLKIGDKIAISIEKNQYGRNFYKLLDKEETQEQEQPPKIKVSEQKAELDRLIEIEEQRQEMEKQEENRKEQERIENEIIEKAKNALEEINKEIQKEKAEENQYKLATNQDYKGFKGIKLTLLNKKYKELENIPNSIKKMLTTSILGTYGELKKDPNYFKKINFSKKENKKISEQKTQWNNEIKEKKEQQEEQKKAMENITENLEKYTIFYSNLKKDINFINLNQDNKEKLKEIKNFSEKIKEIGKNYSKQIERVLTQKTIERI